MTGPLTVSFDVACSAGARVRRVDVGHRHVVAHRSHRDRAGRAPIVLEAGVGGRIFERTSDGVEHDWGQVTAWEPPTRLGYLWHLGQDRADATEVEIRFVARGATATRVEIEHRGWERLGAAGDERRVRNQGGWRPLLPHFRAAMAKGGDR